MRIASLWIGPQIPRLTRLALKSWLRHGEGVDLYVADPGAPPSGIPDGVAIKSAGKVLPLSLMDDLAPLVLTHLSPRQERLSYSDIFRIMLQQRGLGFWMDTDVVLFRDFSPAPDTAYFAFDKPNTIGVSALYFPPDDPCVTDFLKIFDTPDLWPHWLGFKRARLKPLVYKLRGKPFRATDLGITVYGNEAITRILKKQNRYGEARPMEEFYYLPGSSFHFFEPEYAQELVGNPKIIGLHVHQKALSEEPPKKGSVFDLLLAEYGLSGASAP
ncbi:hypothetical protein [Tropicimonas sp. S265A]|uniref:hypothetical protein n=1 Tax=Tropicimonas sp. S265A TaxID=3415134 RepID=UPI003C7CAC34